MPSDWLWTLNSKTYPVYTNKYDTPEAHILVGFALRPAVFKISNILYFPIDCEVKRSPLTRKKEKNKNLPNIQTFTFYNPFNNSGRDITQEYTWILGS